MKNREKPRKQNNPGKGTQSISITNPRAKMALIGTRTKPGSIQVLVPDSSLKQFNSQVKLHELKIENSEIINTVSDNAGTSDGLMVPDTDEGMISARKQHSVTTAPQVNLGECGKTHQIKVIARFRPLNEVEKEMESKGTGSICVNFLSEESVKVKNSCDMESNFTLDRIFDCNTAQEQVYEQMAISTIADVLNGYNGTIFAYGQSGSGKTYTMYGTDLFEEKQKGIIPRAISHIFRTIDNVNNREIKYQLKFSMLEIYKENLYDLLDTENKAVELKIKEHPQKGTYVAGLSEEYISSEDEFLLMVESADENRATASTGLNASSSRSHLLFQLEIIQTLPDDTQKRGTLNLVDLAGSEKIAKTHAIGQTLEEAKKINLSLSTLGNVIHALTSNSNDFVPYRESKLTRILKDSLGGNYKTTLIVTCSPHIFNSEETITTLKFAQRAKKIKNKVKINIKRSVEQLEAIIEELNNQLRLAYKEIRRLKGLPAGAPVKICDDTMNSVDLTETKSLDNSKILGTICKASNDNLIKVDYINENKPFLKYNQDNYQSILRQKDEEIAQLNEKNETLSNENKELNEKLASLAKENNLFSIIADLEKLTKSNISDLMTIANSYSNQKIDQVKAENEKLKEMYSILEQKYIKFLKQAECHIKDDDMVNVKDFYINRDDVITGNFEFDKLFSQEIFTNSTGNFPESYKNIYLHAKMYTGYVLKGFLKRSQAFSEQIPTDAHSNSLSGYKSEYNTLRNSYLKLSNVVIMYEKILFDFMNRALLDIRKYESEAKIKTEIDSKCLNFAKVFSSYLEVLEDTKEIKLRKEREENLIDTNMKYTSRNFNMLKSFGSRRESIDKAKDEDKDSCKGVVEKIIVERSDSPNISKRQNEAIMEILKDKFINKPSINNKEDNIGENLPKRRGSEDSKEGDAKKYEHKLVFVTESSEGKEEVNDIADSNSPKGKLLDVGFGKNNNLLQVPKRANIDREKRATKMNMNIVRGVTRNPTRMYKNFGLLMGHIFNNPQNEKAPDSGIFKKLGPKCAVDCLMREPAKEGKMRSGNLVNDESKKLKNELSLYRNLVDTLTKELNSIHSTKRESEKIIKDFQDFQKQILEKELSNVERVIEIYKNFYEEELREKNNIIDELAKLVDDMYYNTGNLPDSFKEISHNPRSLYQSPQYLRANLLKSNHGRTNARSSSCVLKDYYEYQKEQILSNSSLHENNNAFKLAESILKDGGTATKKLDYILFQVEKNQEEFAVEFGSGLQGQFPSKSPLTRNLMVSLTGDSCNEITSLSSNEN